MSDDRARRKAAARSKLGRTFPFLHELLRNIRGMSPVTRGQTLESVAQHFDLSKGQLSKIELGEVLMPQLEQLNEMLRYYQCPYELTALVRYLRELHPNVFMFDDDSNYRIRTVLREKVREVAESRKHDVTQFLDVFLPDTIDDVRTEWTIYHISVNAISNSLRYDKNHWLRSQHRREWFINQVCLPPEERRIFLLHRLDDSYWSHSNVTCIDGLFCYYEYQRAFAQQQFDERPLLKASPETLHFFSSLDMSLRASSLHAEDLAYASVARLIENATSAVDAFDPNDENLLSEKQFELGPISWRR